MAGMTIASLAREGGVGVETVRYYQRRGLLREPDRMGAVRRYDVEDARRLRFIRSAQRAGFSLAEIAELLELDAAEDRSRAREIARDRLRQIDQRIADLNEARGWLSRLERECAAGKGDECPILRAFAG